MRVISGRAKNVPIECPKGLSVRPMLARVRDAVFNIFRQSTQDAPVLDLFSGCGSVGIEALSRGAPWCVFVERDRRTRAMLEENLARARLAEFCDVIEGDVFRCLPRLKRLDRRYRLVVADPPYPLWDSADGRAQVLAFLDSLLAEDLLAENPWFVVHHHPRAPAPKSAGSLVLDEQRKYGNSTLSIYALKSAGGDDILEPKRDDVEE